MRTAVCFSCNEAYMPLARGLTLSLLEAARFFPRHWRLSLHFLDIGVAPASLDWLRDQGVRVHGFARSDFPGLPGADLAPSYADAQICRPFLPRIIPDQDVYVWMDTDMWVQGSDALTAIAQGIAGFPDKLLICPEQHYGYIGHRNLRFAVLALRRWYMALYHDEALADELSFLPVYNTGLFAMRADCPVWEAWAEELCRIYAADHSADRAVLHYAEQFGLNKVAHERKAVLPLDPSFNYACGGSAVFRNPAGKVVVGYPPCGPVKIVHLLDFSRYGRMYLDKGLLYRGGAYLDEAEKSALLALVTKA